MSTQTIDPSTRSRTMWAGCALLATITLGGALVRRAAGADGALVLASIYSIGTIAMAWLTMPLTPYPRWAWFTTGGVMALGLVVSALALPDPAALKDWQGMAWMNPWLFLTFAFVSPSTKSRVCAPGRRWGGWALIGAGTFYTLLLLVIGWLPNRH